MYNVHKVCLQRILAGGTRERHLRLELYSKLSVAHELSFLGNLPLVVAHPIWIELLLVYLCLFHDSQLICRDCFVCSSNSAAYLMR